MRQILHEIRRALLAKTTILIIIVIILIPALVVATSISSVNYANSVKAEGYAEGQNLTFTISVYVYSGTYGTPTFGETVNLSVANHNYLLTTDVAGYANVTLQSYNASEIGNSSYTYDQVPGDSSTSLQGRITILKPEENPYFLISRSFYGQNGTLYTSRYGINRVPINNEPRIYGILVTYQPSNLSSFPNISMYYITDKSGIPVVEGIRYNVCESGITYINNFSSQQGGYNYNESEMKYFGTFKSHESMVITPVNLTVNTNTSDYIFEFFSSNGTEVGWIALNLTRTTSPDVVNSLFFTSELPMLSLFVPLLAMLSAFFVFGRDRVTGVLSTVIVRPISRRSVILSRYLASVGAVFVASLASLGLSSILFHYLLGTYIPLSSILLSLWALSVMICGFSGLIFFASSIMNSIGKIIATVMLAFFFLDFFWTFYALPAIPIFVSTYLLNQSYGTLEYLRTQAILDYITPSGYTNLITYLQQHNVSTFVLASYPVSEIYLTLPLVLAAGLLWILLPLLASLISFSRHD
ncbi:MAG: ABC transporter permease [Candidatus Thermoplasmatota archaeon]|nr:ABC transporter permease [Candidatus Thermoplasmatota archaeon]